MVSGTRRIILSLALLLSLIGAARAEAVLTVASTTSTENSGLFAHLLPQFTASTGIRVRVIAVGTGQALHLARNGDADVLLTHHRSSEETFVAEGFGLQRHPVMYNDFVIVGPADDPAGIVDASLAAEAFARIAAIAATFASRGDQSGTHKAERAIWQRAGLDPEARRDAWYRELGAGMGATLNAAVAMQAYTLTDRATWLSFANRRAHRILLQGDPALFNQYAVIAVNPAQHPHIDSNAARSFIDWLLSGRGQSAINAFRLKGQQVFHANGG